MQERFSEKITAKISVWVFGDITAAAIAACLVAETLSQIEYLARLSLAVISLRYPPPMQMALTTGHNERLVFIANAAMRLVNNSSD